MLKKWSHSLVITAAPFSVDLSSTLAGSLGVHGKVCDGLCFGLGVVLFLRVLFFLAFGSSRGDVIMVVTIGCILSTLINAL
ncbi:hypothetical protein P7K49_001145, partial [Saguinus oedipus]